MFDINGDRIEIPYKSMEQGPLSNEHPFMGSGILPPLISHEKALEEYGMSIRSPATQEKIWPR